MNVDERIINFFKTQNLNNKNFFKYIEDRILLLPSNSDVFWYGCYPILEDNIIKDIRLVVPKIETEQDFLINIHEFTHALDIYNELGRVYEERRELREKKAKNMEKTYAKQKK